MAVDIFGSIAKAADATLKYNPFIKPISEVSKLVNNPSKAVDTVSNTVSDGWDYVKDKGGLTPIDTAYNLVTGTQGIPSKVVNTAFDAATNIIDAADDLGKGAVDAVKKYWPLAAAGVVGAIALKAAAPEIVKRILN